MFEYAYACLHLLLPTLHINSSSPIYNLYLYIIYYFQIKFCKLTFPLCLSVATTVKHTHISPFSFPLCPIQVILLSSSWLSYFPPIGSFMSQQPALVVHFFLILRWPTLFVIIESQVSSSNLLSFASSFLPTITKSKKLGTWRIFRLNWCKLNGGLKWLQI